MKKAPTLYTLAGLMRSASEVQVNPTGTKIWVPGRSLGLDTIGNRIRCAWLVFTGQADAVIWPEGQ